MSKKGVLYFILAFAAFLVIVGGYFVLKADSPLINNVSFSEVNYGVEITPYYDEKADIYYLFLPNYAKADEIKIGSSGLVRVQFSDETTKYGKTISGVPFSQNVTMTLKNFGQTETYTFQIWQGANLPTVYVETASGNLEYVDEDRENEEEASVLIIDADGTVLFRGVSSIEGRGNITREQAKRPYNLKFDQMTNLLGGEESARTWCLLANYADDSQIRNAMCYYAAGKIGIPYTSETDFVAFYVNGGYMGLYNVATKQSYLNDTDSSVEAVFEQTDEPNYTHDYVSEYETYVRFRYGEADTIVSAVNLMDDLLLSETNVSYEEIAQYIDVASFARKYLLEACCANYDNFKSQYYAIDNDGRIYAVCPWDYDLTLGISYNRYVDISYNMEVMSNPWYIALFQYEEFRQEVLQLLRQYSDFFQQSWINHMDSCCTLIGQEWTLNQIRWKNEEAAFGGRTKLKCDMDLMNLPAQKEYISNFIKKRLAFLDAFWNDRDRFFKLTFTDATINGANTDSITIYYDKTERFTKDLLPDGLMTIPVDGFLGWYTEDGVSIADVEVVSEDMTFYGKWEENADKWTTEEAGLSPEIDEALDVEEVTEQGIIKKAYHFLGLDAFDRKSLVLGGVFLLLLIGVLVEEIIRSNRQRR